MPNAVALEKNYGQSDYIIRTIAQTSRQSWAETNFANRRFSYDEDKDLKGPLIAAMAISTELGLRGNSSHYRKKREFRLVTIGDGDFISNRVLDTQANADFFLNCLAWVSGVADRISIRPKEVEGEKIPISEQRAEAIFYSSTLALPITLLSLGCLVWWRRRNR